MSTTAASGAQQRADLSVLPADAALGAEIRGVDLTKIDGATFQTIHDLWLEHLLLVFRRQEFASQDLVNLVRRFGTPVTSSNLHKRDLAERTANKVFNLPPEVTVVTNVRENGKPVGILGDGEVVWHSDFSFKEAPTAARMLLAVEIPPAGGCTYFLNCYAAYDALSADMKRRMSGKTIKQANIVDTAMQVRPGASLDMDIRDIPGPSHPIISTHPETGRNMIFLGRRHSAYVNGCTLEESEALLNELWAHTTQPRFIYEHHWAVGDVVVWDNRATLHRRDAFDSNSRRVLYAAQVEGHCPYEAPDALSLPPHRRYHAAVA
ncbi:MAG: putative TauD/TfdA family dioxygenase [Proteobacteria bacterium]|nr:putative TauD/TfdA family dioxygenase [Pseudomonadota bacterium]